MTPSGQDWWKPAATCFPCPVETKVETATWPSANPMPGFALPGSAYYSLPLRAPYLPMEEVTKLDEGALGGAIHAEASERFMALAYHELVGHGQLDQQDSCMRQLFRTMAALAYGHLADYMAFGTEIERANSAWDDLHLCNRVIGDIAGSIALSEELFATLLGFFSLRHRPGNPLMELSLTRIDEIEEEFVERQSGRTRFGPRFGELYRQLDRTARLLGNAPLIYAWLFSQELLRVGDQGLTHHDMSAEVSERRLRSALDILNSLPPSRKYSLWKLADWKGFFEESLGAFRPWLEDVRRARECLGGDSASDNQWCWDGRYEVSPVDGGRITLAANINPPLVIQRVSEVMEELAASLDGQPSEEDGPFNRPLCDFMRAQNPENGRAVTLLGVPRGAHGLVFVPAPLTGQPGKVIPVARLLQRGSRLAETEARNVEALVFYEGLRMQIATGSDIVCPASDGTNCCERKREVNGSQICLITRDGQQRRHRSVRASRSSV